MELSKAQISKLRKVELDILKDFIRVCEKLDIDYFIVQGTLLGAVRHHGFIPWDDDIDVGMLRKDYEVFLRDGQKLLSEKYFIQNYDTDPCYPHGFAKIRDSSTAFVETTCKNLHMNHGIFIDVFPFDYYPESFIEKTVFETRKFLLRYRIRSSLYIPADKKITLGNCIRNLVKIISKIRYPSLDRALRLQTELYGSIKQGRRYINNGSPWGKRECVPKEWMNETTVLEFEGIKVKAPRLYKEYLKSVYGDYMELPPEDKRIPHHYISALDFTRPYHVNE